MRCLCVHDSKIWSAGQGVKCSSVFCLLTYVLMGTQKPEQGAFRLRVCLEAWCSSIRGRRQSHSAINDWKGSFVERQNNAFNDLCNPNTWLSRELQGFCYCSVSQFQSLVGASYVWSLELFLYIHELRVTKITLLRGHKWFLWFGARGLPDMLSSLL